MEGEQGVEVSWKSTESAACLKFQLECLSM